MVILGSTLKSILISHVLIQKPCSICFEPQCKHIITCSKCVVDGCVVCITTSLQNNQGQIPCPFCRHVVGQKVPLTMVDMMSQGMRLNVLKKQPEAMLDGIHLSN